jgi:hypothetical protein
VTLMNLGEGDMVVAVATTNGKKADDQDDSADDESIEGQEEFTEDESIEGQEQSAESLEVATDQPEA